MVRIVPEKPSPTLPYQARLLPGHFAPRYWLTWLGIGILYVLQRGPRVVLRWSAGGVARLIERGSLRRRKYALRNLQLCFPEAGEQELKQLLRDYYRALAQSSLDYGMLWFGSARTHARCIVLQGEEYYLALREQNHPVILLAPHSVALDHGGLRMSQLHDGVSFAKPMRNPVVEWMNHRSRTRYSGDIFSRDQGLRPAIREIRKGRFFYFLPDEDLGLDSAVFADFFNVPKATLTSLGRLVKITGAKVIPSFSYYDAATDRYVLRLWPPLDPFPTDDSCTDALIMNRAIETAVRVAPAQYYWGMKLFRTRPPGEPDPYA